MTTASIIRHSFDTMHNHKPSSLPSHARLAFKGIIFEVWQWEQEMFDGSVATFEKLRRPDTVQIVAVVGDKILLQEQEQPARQLFLSLPGGRVDAGEDTLSAAKRELLEETGYVSDDWILWKEYVNSGHIVYNMYTFIARNCRYDRQPHLDSGEKITCRLITFDEFLMLSDEPRFRGREMVELLLRARMDGKMSEEIKSLLFKK